MAVEKVPMTPEGFTRRSTAELQRRQGPWSDQRIIQAIAEAREHGDLSENAEYHAAKEAQGLNEAKVSELEDKISARRGDRCRRSFPVTRSSSGRRSDLVDEDTEDEVTYRIVGELEADVKQGKVSDHVSDRARAHRQDGG